MSHDPAALPDLSSAGANPGPEIAPGVPVPADADALFSLMEGVQRHVQMLATLRADHDTQSRALSDREQQIAERGAALNSLESEFQIRRQALEAEAARIQELTRNFEERENSLAARLNEAENNQRIAQENLAQAQSRFDEARRADEAAAERYRQTEQLAAEVTRREQELAERQAAATAAAQVNDEALRQLEEARARAASLERELGESRQAQENRERELNERLAAVSAAAHQSEESSRLLEEARAAAASFQSQLDEARSALEQNQQRFASMSAEVEAARRSAEQAGAELQGLRAELDSTRAERDALRSRTQEAAALAERLAQAESQLAQHRSTIDQLNGQLNEFAPLRETLQTREAQLAEVATRLQGAHFEAQSAREEAFKLGQELKAAQEGAGVSQRLQEALEQARATAEKASSESESRGFRINEIEAQLAQKIVELDASSATLAQLRSEFDQMSQELARSAAARQAAEREVAQVQRELAEAQSRVSEMQERIASAETALARAEAQHTDFPDVVANQMSDLRRKRLRSYRAALTQQAEKLAQAKALLTSKLVEAKAVAEQKSAVANQTQQLEQLRRQVEDERVRLLQERQDFNQEQAAAIAERASETHPELVSSFEAPVQGPTISRNAPAFFAAGLGIALAATGLASWFIAGKIAQPMCSAQMSLAIDRRDEKPSDEQVESWKSYIKELPADERLLERAAERYKARGFTELSTPAALGEELKHILDIDTTQDGGLTLTMRYPGFDRSALALDTLGTTILGFANDTRDMRADRSSTLILVGAKASPDALEDPRMAIFGAIYGALAGVTLFGSVLVYRRLRASLPQPQPRAHPVPARAQQQQPQQRGGGNRQVLKSLDD